MDWDDVIDRKGTFEFVGIGKALRDDYVPEDVQSLVDTYGAREMVRIINESYQKRHGMNALQLVNNGGELKIVRA